MSVTTILLWVLGALLLLLVLGLLVWWLRTQSGSAVRSFYAALRQMERDLAVHDRYDMPWLLMLGDDKRGAQLCASWRLGTTAKPAWFGRWWADPDGAVLVVPDALFVPEEGASAQMAAWWRLLGLLLRLRSQRPLDGIIWAIPAERLLSSDQASAYGLAARRKFIDMLQRLGLSLPVHVVITGMEEVPGFQALLAALPEESRESCLGWASPYGPDAAWQSHWSEIALTEISRSVSEVVIELGTLSGGISDELYRLPQQLDALHDNLQLILDPVFQGNALGEAPRFRGVFLTASQALGDTNEWDGAAGAPRRSLFSHGLWHKRLIAEQGLVQAVPRILRLRQRWQQVVGIAALVVAVIWVAGMAWVWHDGVDEAERLAGVLQRAQVRYVAINDETRRRDLTRQNVQTFWGVLEQAPRWRYTSLVYPTSWFSSLDGRLADILRSSALTQLYQPLYQLMEADYQALSRVQPSGRGSNIDGSDPELWPNYVNARALAEGALRVEQQNQLFTHALNHPQGPLDDLAQMSNLAFGLNLNIGTLRQPAYYNRVLSTAAPSSLQPLDLQRDRPQIAEHFQRLMQLWLAQYSLSDNFVRPAGYLRIQVNKLRDGYGNSLEELETTSALIDDLQEVIGLTNSAWSRSSGRDLVPGYRTLLEDVEKSSLLGPSVSRAVDNQAARLQSTFRDQWVARAGTSDNLLVQQSTGALSLQESVIGLDNAIDSLLKYDFVALVLGQKEASGRNQSVDGNGLGAALGYFDSYKSYASRELPQIPPAFRTALLGAAQSAAATAMWYSLETRANLPRLRAQQTFDVPADKALLLQKAFVELKRPDLAQTLQNVLNQRALADVVRALEEVEVLPVFHQRYAIEQWDGTKNLGLQLFRSTDTQDLKLSLTQQFAIMQKTTEDHVAALEWLKVQQGNLSAADYDKVSRLLALNEEMLKYKGQNPVSSPALFEQLVSRDFIDMDVQSCSSILQSANVPRGADDVSRRGLALWNQAQQRCVALQQERGALAWNRLAGHFNQYLADRFPFSYDVDAKDADPERVRYMIQLIDTSLEQAESALAYSRSVDRLAAQDFLDRLKQARVWLGPLLVRDQDGVVGLDMDILWRTDRDGERGADQIIAWGLHTGSQSIVYPGDEQTRLNWTVGEPIKLLLRWAKNGSQRPANDPLQPSLAVHGLEAGWEYTGPWSLLRLMRSHVSVQRQPSIDHTQFPLTLQLPVHAPYTADTQAQMFMRLSLLTQGGKMPLSVQPLPVRAPQSPFAVTSDTPLLSAQETP
ncbi:MAG: type VI secretion system protein [Pseudomonas sp.]|uniref:type VI secretion system protein n=1 Tax=Pseudomonas sp. TaxID=306 RepID=UPI003D0F4BCE